MNSRILPAVSMIKLNYGNNYRGITVLCRCTEKIHIFSLMSLMALRLRGTGESFSTFSVSSLFNHAC